MGSELRVSDACTILELEKQFPHSCTPTVGCQIQPGIVDRKSKEPRNLFRAIKDLLPPSLGERTQPGLLGAQLEYSSRLHACVNDLADELRCFEEAAAIHASKFSAELAWEANFPYRDFDPATLGESNGDDLPDRLGPQASQQVMNSVRFHASVPRSKAIQVTDSLQAYLPLFSALSANSPIHHGRPTGRMSYRGVVLSSNSAVCGLSQSYGDWHGFRRRMARLIESGRIRSPEDNYYFVRPTQYGAVELRCCDLPCSLEHVIVLAALYQTLVVGLMEGMVTFRPEHDFLRAEMHDAISRGLQAELCDHTGRRGTPLEWLARLRYDLEPISVGLKTDGVLALAPSVLEVDGAAMQLREFESRKRILQLASRYSAADLRRRVIGIAISTTAAGASGLAAGIWL